MADWKKKLDDWLGGGEKGEKRPKLMRFLILLGLVGALLMVLSQMRVKQVDPGATGRASPPGATESVQPAWGAESKSQTPFHDYEQAYESELKEIMEKIVGVGQVEVLVTIDSTEESIVEKSVKQTQQTTNEKDQAGATRHVTDVSNSGEVVLYQVSGNQAPLIVKTIKPKIRGVVVVAEGAENLTVKKLLLEAVERGLDVPVNRISVIPRKQ
ncbi:stage III sporulation protein AG [Gorillibacterium sp. CAU 1737]|uniref:stage III sporulation protein AG n=1 Tax=Gorillibacterium sp. CAU 1737 TaxID=3140362 RepID=UPI00325FE3C5